MSDFDVVFVSVLLSRCVCQCECVYVYVIVAKKAAAVCVKFGSLLTEWFLVYKGVSKEIEHLVLEANIKRNT